MEAAEAIRAAPAALGRSILPIRIRLASRTEPMLTWNVQGQLYESCRCNMFCPCWFGVQDLMIMDQGWCHQIGVTEDGDSITIRVHGAGHFRSRLLRDPEGTPFTLRGWRFHQRPGHGGGGADTERHPVDRPGDAPGTNEPDPF